MDKQQQLLSNSNKAILMAVEKGYTVDDFGQVFYKNKKVLGYIVNLKSGMCYHQISIKNCGAISHLFVHRLIAYQKFGRKIFEKGIVVRHLDGVSTNNNSSNIAIGKRKASHPKHNHAEIISDYKNGMSYLKLMGKYGVSSKGTMSFIIRKAMANEHQVSA